MPTKPVSTFTFATDANFSSGPASGDPVKVVPTGAAQGYVPGDGIESESVNYLFNICGEWVTDWLSQGSSAGDEDAHLVETDSTGRITAAVMTVGSHSSESISARFLPPTGGGTTLLVSGGGAGDAISVSHSGTGNPIQASSTGTNTAPAVLGLGSDNAASIGVQGTAGDGAGTWGVYGLGGDNSSSYAVYGLSAHDDAVAIRGALPATATSSAYAVQGTGNGAGNGVLASVVGGGTGYALYVFPDTSSPDRAAVHIEPSTGAEPSTDVEGDIYVDGDRSQLMFRDVGGFKGLHHSPGGHSFAYDEDLTSGSNASGATLAQATAILNPAATGTVYVTGIINLGTDASTTEVDVILWDDTDSAEISRVTFTGFNGEGNAGEKTCVLRAQYTLPDTDARTFIIQTERFSGAGTTYWENASITVVGVY